MGKIELDHTGTGGGITLSSDGTDLLLDGTAVGGLELYAENPSNPTAPNASATNSVAIGKSSVSGGGSSIAIGASASSGGNLSSALGFNATVGSNGSYSAAIGRAYSNGADSFAAAITNNTSSYGATGANSIAMGRLAKSTNSDSIAIGYNNRAVGARSIAAGYDNLSYADGFCFGNGNGSQSASIAAGRNNNAWGNGSVAIGDGNEVASNAIGGICIGQSCDVNNDHDKGLAIGSAAQTRAKGHHVYANYSSSYQSGRWIVWANTTDATATSLSTDNTSASTANQIILPNNSAYAFHGTIVARQQAAGGTASAAWKIEGLIRREGTAGTTTLVNSATTVLDNTPSWGMALSADTTNGGLAITVTGAALTNIRWVATIHTSEVTYA